MIKHRNLNYWFFVFFLVLQSCSVGPLADIEFTDIRWTYVTRENGEADANYGRINRLFILPSEEKLYHDTTYYLAINISVIATSKVENASPRFVTLFLFENFDVTNPIMEVLSSGIYRQLDNIQTNEKGERSKEVAAIYSIPPGKNTELDYYIVFEIGATTQDFNDFPIESKVQISFKEVYREWWKVWKNTSLNFLGTHQDGQPFSININYR